MKRTDIVHDFGNNCKCLSERLREFLAWPIPAATVFRVDPRGWLLAFVKIKTKVPSKYPLLVLIKRNFLFNVNKSYQLTGHPVEINCKLLIVLNRTNAGRAATPWTTCSRTATSSWATSSWRQSTFRFGTATPSRSATTISGKKRVHLNWFPLFRSDSILICPLFNSDTGLPAYNNSV